jgi:alanine racemase
MPSDPSRPTVAEIDLGALRSNLRSVRRRVGRAVAIAAVVKANAYGHGSRMVAQTLENAGADAFGVAFAEEGAELRQEGIRLPIHVFTLPAPGQIPLYLAHDLEATIATVREARALNAAAEREGTTVRVHLKIDTGMNRIGVRSAAIESLLRALGRMRRLEIKGVFTHFAVAEIRDTRFTELQLERFEEAIGLLRRHGVTPEAIHCANSAAIIAHPESYFTMVRPGIMLYGYAPSGVPPKEHPIRPVMTLRSSVAMVKEIGPGESVSYGRQFIARRRTRIATVPIGYADGYSRLLTGRTSVLIGGRRHPVAGTICMDQLMVDVGRLDVRPGDDVVLIGTQRGSRITAQDLGDLLGTIPYEICCAVSARVPRTYRNV